MTARTLLLLPGLLCDREIWAPQIAAFESDYRIVVPDLWGYDSFEAMAEATLAEAPARFSLAGHSMGGRVALEIMQRAPERVERLALLSTGVHPVREAEIAPRLAQVALAERDGIEALVQEWLPPMLHARYRSDPKLVGAIVSMWCRGTPEIFAKQIHAALHRRDLRPSLAGIHCPTLVLVGADDTWSPPAQHEAIAAAIPDAELAIVPESGHMVTLEAPARVNTELRRWLARQPVSLTQEA